MTLDGFLSFTVQKVSVGCYSGALGGVTHCAIRLGAVLRLGRVRIRADKQNDSSVLGTCNCIVDCLVVLSSSCSLGPGLRLSHDFQSYDLS